MKRFIFTLLLLYRGFLLCANEEESKINFDFVNQDIKDIVYAVSIAYDMSIICDDTVEGKTTFRFSGNDFDEAANAFLLSNKLYSYYENDTIVVSKIAISKNKELYSVYAQDVLPSELFTKLSKKCSIPIVWDFLPTMPISIHVKDMSIIDIISVIMQSFTDYSVENKNSHILICKNKIELQKPFQSVSNDKIIIEEIDNIYSINVENASFYNVIEELFKLQKTDFSNLLPNDRIINRLVYSNSDFNSVLTMICSQIECGYTFYNNTYILYGVDNASNKIKNPELFWKTISLDFINSQSLISLFKSRFPDTSIYSISETSVQVAINPSQEHDIDSFIQSCDISNNSKLITLKYLKTEEFLNFLPPGYSVNQFTDTGSGFSIYYTGSEKSHSALLDILKDIDKPNIVIGYDLLVLQVQESESFKWKPSFSAKPVKPGDRTNIGGHIDSGFAFNFDIVSAFGYTFATELQTAIGENKAQVYVDTQLQGVSGKPISFQNTNTFRYQDTAINPDTGKPVYSGITREIIAGLVINIDGWASGDGMITTKVSASLSRRGSDVGDTGYLPPTSEKIITTEVQGKSGEVIVLSGLMQNDSTFVEDAVPGISKIPLLGWLFKSKSTSEERTEMIIYLVPHILSSSSNY